MLCVFNNTHTHTACTEGEIRLVGGSMSGRLEVCLNERWGTVCDDGWTGVNTEIVCGQLGFSTSRKFSISFPCAL